MASLAGPPSVDAKLCAPHHNSANRLGTDFMSTDQNRRGLVMPADYQGETDAG